MKLVKQIMRVCSGYIHVLHCVVESANRDLGKQYTHVNSMPKLPDVNGQRLVHTDKQLNWFQKVKSAITGPCKMKFLPFLSGSRVVLLRYPYFMEYSGSFYPDNPWSQTPPMSVL